jgi:hypothetical protein
MFWFRELGQLMGFQISLAPLGLNCLALVQSWGFCTIFAISMASNPPVVLLKAVTIELQSHVSTRLCKKHARRCRIIDDVDIVTHILDQIKASTLCHRLNWVKAHQDDKRPYQDLDIWG